MTLVVTFGVFAAGVVAIRSRPLAGCGDLLFGAARVGALSGAMVCMLGLVASTPAGLVLGALSGLEASAALWVLRCPSWRSGEDSDDGDGHGGGGGGPDEPRDGDGPDGDVRIDWDAVERDAYNAWREQTLACPAGR